MKDLISDVFWADFSNAFAVCKFQAIWYSIKSPSGFGLDGYFRQNFSLYQIVSKNRYDRGEKLMSKLPLPHLLLAQ